MKMFLNIILFNIKLGEMLFDIKFNEILFNKRFAAQSISISMLFQKFASFGQLYSKSIMYVNAILIRNSTMLFTQINY